jgi:flotillin
LHNSEAARREKEAEALRIAMAAEKVQQAKALEESYVAEQKAELARAERERSTQNANIVIPAEIAKQRAIIEAQAEAEKIRENKQKVKQMQFLQKWKQKQKVYYEILTKQAEGYKEVVSCCWWRSNKSFPIVIN